MLPNKTVKLLLVSVAASVCPAQSLSLQYGEVVQGVGDNVPGLAGVTIGGTSPYGLPVIDLDGNILWRARLAGAVTPNVDDQGLFYGRSANDLTMFLRRGGAEPTATMPGVTVNYSLTTWDAARLAPSGGRIMFASSLAGAGVTTANDTCMFWGQPSNLFVLAREGDPAPSGGSTIGANIGGGQNITGMNSSGIALMRVKLAGGDVVANVNDDAWLIGSPGAMNWMCREGDPLLGGAVAVGALDGFKPEIDELGRVLFPQPLSTTLGTSPAQTTDDSTIMLYTPGVGLSIVMREGDPAPGTGLCVYGSISSGSGWSNHGFSRTTGQLVFTNTMTGGDVIPGNTNDTAVFAGPLAGPMKRVAREAETAPTGVAGEIYQALFPNGTAQINDAGTVVFAALIGPTGGVSTFADTGVFLARPPYGAADVQLILREGDGVAGLPTGWVIGNTSGGGMSATGTTMMLNEQDTVLISVAGVGDPTQANWGVPAQIAWDPQHGARLVGMQGDTYTIGGNPQVQSAAPGIVATGSGDGGNLSFNNNGDQVVRMFFTGTVPTAIVRNQIGAMIAEPSTVSVGGGTQNFHIDCGPAHAGEFYFVLASGLGSRPGFPSPIGPQTVPLALDPLWTLLSFDMVNTSAWTNTFGITDGNGAATASFNLPPGFPYLAGVTLHHAAIVFDGSIVSTFVTEAGGLKFY